MSFRWTRRRFTAAVGTALILPAGVPAFAAGEKPVVLHAPEASAPALIELCRALQPAGLPANPRVGIKIHGGEARVNYPLFAALRDAYPGAAFVETNWASDFGGSRRHTRTHIEEIRSQGVTGPIDVLDREERDEDYVTVPVRNGIELSEIETTRASLWKPTTSSSTSRTSKCRALQAIRAPSRIRGSALRVRVRKVSCTAPTTRKAKVFSVASSTRAAGLPKRWASG